MFVKVVLAFVITLASFACSMAKPVIKHQKMSVILLPILRVQGLVFLLGNKAELESRTFFTSFFNRQGNVFSSLISAGIRFSRPVLLD